MAQVIEGGLRRSPRIVRFPSPSLGRHGDSRPRAGSSPPLT